MSDESRAIPPLLGWSEGDHGDSENPPEQPSIGPEDTTDAICWINDGEDEPPVWHANARRLTAAWNACREVPVEALEAGAVADLLAATGEALAFVRHTLEFFEWSRFPNLERSTEELRDKLARATAAATSK